MFAADYENPSKNIYSYDNFESIADNKEPRTGEDEGMRDMKIITEIDRSCGRSA